MKIRIKRTKDYTVMSNYHLRDKNLSLKTKGLLSLMLSLPNDWDFSENGLATICKEGKDTIHSCLKELEENGYLTRTQTKQDGKFGKCEYTLYEKPLTENPSTEKPSTENPTQLNTNKQNIDKQSKEKENKEKEVAFSNPTITEVEEYVREQGLTVDAQKFVDYYNGVGWMVGKTPIWDWKSVIKGWQRKEKTTGGKAFWETLETERLTTSLNILEI